MSEGKKATRLAASQSYSQDEVQVLEVLILSAMTGQPVSVTIVRSAVFAKVARKVQSMSKRIKHVKAQRAASDDHSVEG